MKLQLKVAIFFLNIFLSIIFAALPRAAMAQGDGCQDWSGNTVPVGAVVNGQTCLAPGVWGPASTPTVAPILSAPETPPPAVTPGLGEENTGSIENLAPRCMPGPYNCCLGTETVPAGSDPLPLLANLSCQHSMTGGNAEWRPAAEATPMPAPAATQTWGEYFCGDWCATTTPTPMTGSAPNLSPRQEILMPGVEILWLEDPRIMEANAIPLALVAAGAGVTQLDSPLPGPADLPGGTMIVLGAVIIGGNIEYVLIEDYVEENGLPPFPSLDIQSTKNMIVLLASMVKTQETLRELYAPHHSEHAEYNEVLRVFREATGNGSRPGGPDYRCIINTLVQFTAGIAHQRYFELKAGTLNGEAGTFIKISAVKMLKNGKGYVTAIGSDGDVTVITAYFMKGKTLQQALKDVSSRGMFKGCYSGFPPGGGLAYQ